MNQKQLYRVVDKLISRDFSNEIELLEYVIKELVLRDDIVVTGGRLWEIHPERESYILQFVYGIDDDVPVGYEQSISDQPIFSQLSTRHAVVSVEPREELRKKGVHVYSGCGLGERIKRPSGVYFRYALALSAREEGRFVDTINIITSALSLRLNDLRHKRESAELHKDLTQAWEIQRGLLPEHEATFRDYQIFGISVPEKIVGGDYFDYFHPTLQYDERFGIVISDAASKGLPAAIQALFVSGALRMGIGFNTKMSELLSRLNNLLYDTFPFERFVTLFYCELSTSTNGLVLYANAGHVSPIHFRSRTKTLHELEPTGSLLGIALHQKFAVENINMLPGDCLVLVTDGIIEAQNRKSELFGEKRLRTLIRKYSHLAARELACMIVEEVQKYSVGGAYSDDKTIVVIKRNLPNDSN